MVNRRTYRRGERIKPHGFVVVDPTPRKAEHTGVQQLFKLCVRCPHCALVFDLRTSNFKTQRSCGCLGKKSMTRQRTLKSSELDRIVVEFGNALVVDFYYLETIARAGAELKATMAPQGD